MFVDNKAQSVVRLGRDLQPGDIVNHNNKTFIIHKMNALDAFCGRHYYEIFDLYNSDGPGPYLTSFDVNEEFVVITSKKKILRVYDAIEFSLLKIAANATESRGDLIRIKKVAIDGLNKKLFDMKKELVEEAMNG